MKLKLLIVFAVFCFSSVFSQTVLNKINGKSYKNFADSYNYTYWDTNWLTPKGSANRSFTNQTNDYALNIDFDNLSIKSLLLVDDGNTPDDGFNELNKTTFTKNYSGTIDYAILKNGNVLYKRSNTPTLKGNKDSQMAEFGTWCNRRFVSTLFTNSAPVDLYFTGIEFTNWHNRFKITFHVKPTANIVNGQLQLAVTIPSEYNKHYQSGYNTAAIHAFGLNNQKGFVVRGGEDARNVSIKGNKLTVTTNNQNLIANKKYKISIIFNAVKENLSSAYTAVNQEESEISIAAEMVAPTRANISKSSITYDKDEGVHFVEIPRQNMGYNDCGSADVLQKINFRLTNSKNRERKVRLCLTQFPSSNITGFNALICNNNGDPSGLPLQISKNWHTTTNQLYSGNWIKEYTELIIPANTTLNFQYKKTGAKWGETYTASSHQLSVVGAGVPRGGWLEAALGTFGESVTHSPDYVYGNTNAADVRPFLVTNQNYGGNSKECGWTGNVGGLDMWVYEDAGKTRQYQSQVKTKFHRYSPSLSETTVGAVSADGKLKLDYTFYLNRSDDYLRLYYKVNVEALKSTSFSRFDIFQLGGDIYNVHNTRKVVYGNDKGIKGEFKPTNNGSNDYTTSAIALRGIEPWVWAGDGQFKNGASSGLEIDTNNAMIIRDYNATFNGKKNNVPYFRERSSSRGFSSSVGTKPTSYSIVPPPGVTSFSAGDRIELLVEVVVLPKKNGDYYGSNDNFASALKKFGNAPELLFREASGNKIQAKSHTNTISTKYPLTVKTSGNKGFVTIKGGKGYVPLVFSGLTNITNPKLWKGSNGNWKVVDQSVHGKDFWQTDYKPETRDFDITYNVNQDIDNDKTATFQYYLGNNRPTNSSLVVQTKVGNKNWSSNATIKAAAYIDDVLLAPQFKENGATSVAVNKNYTWTGPNGFTHTGRVLRFEPITEENEGLYRVKYTTLSGTYTAVHTITMEKTDSYIVIQSKLGNNNWSSNANIKARPNRDNVRFAPAFRENGVTSSAVNKNYTWTGPNGFTRRGRVVNFYPVTNKDKGKYIVKYTNSNGSYAAAYTINSDGFAKTIAPTFENIKLYPNPFSDLLNINLKDSKPAKVTITNIIGQVVFSQNIKEGNNTLNLVNLENGVYFVKVFDKEHITIKKIIKK